MSVSLPRGFIPIKDAANAGATGSFIGVLTHIREPFKSKGDDLILQFTIQDEFSGGSVGHNTISSIGCRLFRRSKDELPKNGAIGDLVLIRNVRISNFGDRINLTCGSRDGAVLFFDSRSIPRPELSTSYGEGGLSRLRYSSTFSAQPPTWAEQLSIIHLKAEANPLLPKVQNYSAMRASQPARKDRRTLIQDLTLHNYHDIVGEVVKMFSQSSMTMDLYITDYTTNQDLFLYEDPDDPEVEDFGYSKARKWPGPFGQMTLQIRLWHPHSTWANENVREGDLVLLTDVHAKLSGVNKLEGALHQDQKYPDKVKISKAVLSKHAIELRSRKAKHQAECEKPRDRQGQAVADGAPRKPSAKIAARKKETKKEMQRLQKELEQQELEKKAEDEATSRAGINSHVVASFPEIKLSSVAEILHNPSLKTKDAKGVDIVLPFVNAKYRTRIRVVDFFPHNLEDFARSMADPDWHTALKGTNSGDIRPSTRWEWGFVLLVESSNIPTGTTPERLRLFVNNPAGQHLLNMNASDLKRQQPGRRAIKRLEEKLFILWGNLFELKQELTAKGTKFPLPSGDSRLQNMPFDCCIEEYGSRVPPSVQWPQGWQRMHQPYNTLIQTDSSS